MPGAGEGGQEGLGDGNSVNLCTPRPPALHTPALCPPSLPYWLLQLSIPRRPLRPWSSVGFRLNLKFPSSSTIYQPCDLTICKMESCWIVVKVT